MCVYVSVCVSVPHAVTMYVADNEDVAKGQYCYRQEEKAH